MATQVAYDATGVTTITLPCSELISLDRAQGGGPPSSPTGLSAVSQGESFTNSTKTLPRTRSSISAPPSITSPPSSSATDSYSCDLNGPLNQTGLTTQVAYGADGVTTLTLPCSMLISLDRGAGNPTGQPNATRSGTSMTEVPNYIRPSQNPRSNGCDIYGPIDQMGSIIVGVNLTSTTSTTTVACSSYLAFQSQSVLAGGVMGGSPGRPGLGGTCADPEYQISFGRSPECTSYANGKLDYRPKECGTGPSAVATGLPPDADPQTYCNPPCLINPVQAGAANYNCCGNCRFNVDEVKVLYWPTAALKTQCGRASGVPGGLQSSAPSQGANVTKVLKQRADGPVTEVSNGFTL